MSVCTSTKQNEQPELVDGRYQVEAILGKGGMAVVYQVLDTSSRKKLALKQLLPITEKKKKRSEIAKLFEHEFHTLAQLAHPTVIEVYDYGLDDALPYYTMELLDGGDLRDLSPLPWKKACSLLCDICSALSLLHSRRLVHRDLTPRNVRCTRDGRAKLIDFGAMIPMGPNRQLLGTPPFTAPEVINLQILDGKTDLYSLGATAYHLLTARLAYPANNFAELRDLWRSQPKPPSRFVEDIPKELDEIIMSLLKLDPIARPANAAEVMERLSTLAGLEMDEQISVSQAYLSTPTLVGREEQLLRVRKLIVRALSNKGGTVLVNGASGVGRSRFLDACILEGKLAGAIVIRADASDSSRGKWGAARTMATQLLDSLPNTAMPAARPYVPVLGHVVPEMLDRFNTAAARDSSLQVVDETWERIPSTPSPPPGVAESNNTRDRLAGGDDASCSQWAQVWGRGYSSMPPTGRVDAGIKLETFASPNEFRPRVQVALRDWLREVSREKLLIVAVDDVHMLDEPSAAFIAFLSHKISDRKLVVIVTSEIDAPATSPEALKLLSEIGAGVKLRNLDIQQVEKLLGFVFGEAPNVKFLAARLYTVSGGNPRIVILLAQYLADTGVVRYQAGSWILPGSLEVCVFPGILTEALRARVEKLSPDARRLAQAMSLSNERNFSFDECQLFVENQEVARLVRSLEELVASEVVSTDGQYYCLSQQGWIEALHGQSEEASSKALHLELAAMYELRGTDTFRMIRHIFLAGDKERALDIFVDHAEAVQKRIEQSGEYAYEYLQTLPRDWVEICESLLQLCRSLQRPQKGLYILRRLLVVLGVMQDTTNDTRLLELIDQLVHLSGLEIYHELGDAVEPSTRLERALQLAQQKYDTSPESERVMPPGDAIRDLATALILAAKQSGSTFDHSPITSAPSLEPLLPLSPALGVIEKNIEAAIHSVVGRFEQMQFCLFEILERIEQPDRAGLDDDTTYTFMRLAGMNGAGLMQATLGINTALEWTDKIETHPLFQVNAWRIRKIYHLRQGNVDEAEKIEKRIELLKIQNSPAQFFEGMQLWHELMALAAADDLMRVKQSIAEIEKMAKRFPRWQPILCFARGEYNRIRGDYPSALAEHQQALHLTAPGWHTAWPWVAGSLVQTLFELGRLQQAVEQGRRFLAQAEQEQYRVICNVIRIPLALVEAGLGDGQSAIQNMETAIEQYRKLGMTGLYLGSAYETRARVALMLKDHESFATHAKLCAEQYRAGRNPVLTAKYEKLMAEAHRFKLDVSAYLEHAVEYTSVDEQSIDDLLSSIMSSCQGPGERARRALKIIARHSNCSGGFLYTMQKDGPVLSAATSNYPLSMDLDTMVKDYLAAEMNVEEVTITDRAEPSDDVSNRRITEWTDPQGKRYCVVLLAHYTDKGFVITGLAVICVVSDKRFQFPGRIVRLISEALLDAGDVLAVCPADHCP